MTNPLIPGLYEPGSPVTIALAQIGASAQDVHRLPGEPLAALPPDPRDARLATLESALDTERELVRKAPAVAWLLSSSSDRRSLDIVDGSGRFDGHGPHYSRRTPGSKTFTGVGQEIVLVTDSAVWAVVRQRTPSARGTGQSRGRTGTEDPAPRHVWRNMVFRNLGEELSSALILSALDVTYREWAKRYGKLPVEVLRTEIDPTKIRGTNPGCCYKKAGFHNPRMVRGKLYLDAPCPTLLLLGECSCCPGSSLQGKVDDDTLVR